MLRRIRRSIFALRPNRLKVLNVLKVFKDLKDLKSQKIPISLL